MNLAIFGIESLPARTRSAASQRTTVGRDAPSATPRSWLSRMEAWLWQSRQRELERRLAGCLDVFELEARLRELERVPPHRRYE
jgi:hypothetical protein